jgi:hypothetical protein
LKPLRYGFEELGKPGMVPDSNGIGPMSVLRLAIIASCVVAALPADKSQQARLYDGAVTAAQWAGTYCDREVQKCTQAAEYWEQFKGKAHFAAGVAVDTVQRYSAVADGASNTASKTGAEPSIEMVAVRAAPFTVAVPLVSGRGTLSDQDLKSSWRSASKARKS